MLPVTAGHLWLTTLWPDESFGLGDGRGRPARIDVAYVRELTPAQPPAPPAPSAGPATRVLRAAWQQASAASGPEPAAAAARSLREPLTAAGAVAEVGAEEAESEALVAAMAALPELAPVPELAARTEAPNAVPNPAPDPTPNLAPNLVPKPVPNLVPNPEPTVAVAWPPSTRLSYVLTGNYRGPVEGHARVEWRLAGARYQVSLEVGIGPPFAPLVSRHVQSDGLVTAAGLEPRRYDEETQIVLRPLRRFTITLDADRVLLPSGRELPRPPGVQDSASQFVQMTWLFTMQPERLRPGTLLTLPLALQRQVEVWTYEVIGAQRLDTPVGAIETVHVRPRRPPRSAADARGGGGDLVAEFWVAPTLQYLPVRILIRQDEETYVDLLLQKLPQQGGTEARAGQPGR